MDRVALVHRRKKRYMAVLLGEFEQYIEPHVPADKAEKFKGKIREKLHALALDANEIHTVGPGEEVNAAAVELRDQIDPSGREIPRRVTA